MFKNPTEVWEDQMNDLFLTKKIKDTDKVMEALSIVLSANYGMKNKGLVELYNIKGLDTFLDVISIFERKTITFPSKEEVKEAIMLSLVFYLREVHGYTWEEIKAIVPFDFSSISYAFKIKNLNKFVAEKLLEVFAEEREKLLEESNNG